MDSWIDENMCYKVVTGSIAYGCCTDMSDEDIVGVTVPKKGDIFVPGYIHGFDPKPMIFEQYQQTVPDVAIYSITKFFRLVMNCNPNIIDVLYVPGDCIMFKDVVGDRIRDNREKFLSKKAYHTFRGYAHSQMKQIKTRNPVGKRADLVKKYGYDTKFSYHLIRLLFECKQILENHDLDLRVDSETYRKIRNGEYTLESLCSYFNDCMEELDEIHEKSTLRYSVDGDFVRNLLLECLEIRGIV